MMISAAIIRRRRRTAIMARARWRICVSDREPRAERGFFVFWLLWIHWTSPCFPPSRGSPDPCRNHPDRATRRFWRSDDADPAARLDPIKPFHSCAVSCGCRLCRAAS